MKFEKKGGDKLKDKNKFRESRGKSSGNIMENGQGLSLKALSYSTPYREERPYCDCSASSVLDRVNSSTVTQTHTRRMSNNLLIITLSFILVQRSLHVSESWGIDVHAIKALPAIRSACLKGYCCWESDLWEWRYFWRPCFQPNRFMKYAVLLSSSRCLHEKVVVRVHIKSIGDSRMHGIFMQ